MGDTPRIPADAATAERERFPVEWRKLADVHPYQGNPRQVSDLAVEKVAQSLRNYGWRQPIVVDRLGTIIAGHTRYLAARRLGMDTALVHVADLGAAEARAYRIADNRVAEESKWDRDLLAAELADLDALGLDLPLVVGFDPSELANLLEPAAPPAEDGGGAPSFRVVVSCRDEQHQADTLADLRARGYEAEPG